MSENDPLVQELRAQLQAMAEENQELRVEVRQQQRWIEQLRSTVAAFTGNHFTLSGKPSENTRRRG